ncbi:RodZ domain-containing protein [Roseospira visakhapatnamensis]|uniref:Cytoskeletal protein RodZ n=1 Tax=Roseospira visakhapatnamensis TaxID=390880 RepID=A0A7W6RBU3_9PROT|nr:cytoskeletal protein RodZ [Roseospira visakhapatnamensis]
MTPGHVGSLLQEARLRQGHDLRIIADDLRIRYQYLLAIEAGHYDDLPGPAYAAGFVRGYAEYLGLPAEDTLRRFRDETQPRAGRINHLEFPTPANDGGIPAGAFLLVALIVAGCAYGIWFWLSSNGKTMADLVADIPTVVADLVGDLSDAVPPLPPPPPRASPAPMTEAGAADAVASASDQAFDEPSGPDPDPAPSPPGTASAMDMARADPPAPTREANRLEALLDAPSIEETAIAGPDPAAVDAAPDTTDAPPSAPVAEDPDPAPNTAPIAADGPQAAVSTVAVEGIPRPPSEPDADADTDTNTGASADAGTGTAPAAEDATPDDVAAEDMAAEPDMPDAETVAVAAAPEPEVPEIPVLTVPAVPETAEPAESAEPPVAAVDPEPETEPEPDREPAYVGRAAPSDVRAAGGAARIVLRANRDAWIQLRRNGDLVLRRLLRRGDVYAVPPDGGYILNTSNAGGLEVYVDGRRVRDLGPAGAPRSGVRLSPRALN